MRSKFTTEQSEVCLHPPENVRYRVQKTGDRGRPFGNIFIFAFRLLLLLGKNFFQALPCFSSCVLTDLPLVGLNNDPTEPALGTTGVCIVTVCGVITFVFVSVLIFNRHRVRVVFMPIEKLVSPVVGGEGRGRIIIHVLNFRAVTVNRFAKQFISK